MSLARQQNNNRIDERDARFSGEFSCKLIPNDDEGKLVPIRPIDVSRRGLGFVTREPLKSGTFYWLEIDKHRYRVELAYCQVYLGIDNMFRCGLFLREAEGDLHASCDRAGLLSDKHRSPYK
jgi:hypothetical protein